MGNKTDVTGLLEAWSRGDQEALEKLFPIVYTELKKIARGQLAHERGGDLLQTTELVHEAYLRIVGHRQTSWENRRRFFAFAAKVMRRYLIDRSRARQAGKRGGGNPDLIFDERVDFGLRSSDCSVDFLLSINQALEQLQEVDARSGEVAELRLFTGLDHMEIAQLLEVSIPTIKRDWAFAKRFLAKRLGSARSRCSNEI